MTPKLREIEYFKAWGIFWLLTTFGGFVLGMAVGAVMGGVMGATGASMQSIKTAATILGAVIAVPVSFIGFRYTDGRFIVPKVADLANQPPPLPPTTS